MVIEVNGWNSLTVKYLRKKSNRIYSFTDNIKTPNFSEEVPVIAKGHISFLS